MPAPKLTKLELKIMEALWDQGAVSVREIHETFPVRGRSAYTTVQTIVTRLEAKGAVRRTKKIGNAHIFEATCARTTAHRRLIDDLLGAIGGRLQPLMAHLIESGKLTHEDIKQVEKMLEEHERKEKTR